MPNAQAIQEYAATINPFWGSTYRLPAAAEQTTSTITVPQNQQFFVVWGPQHTYISVLYPTYAEAVTKVTELKQANPIRDYYILSAVSRAAFRESPVICEPLSPAGRRTADVESSTRS